MSFAMPGGKQIFDYREMALFFLCGTADLSFTNNVFIKGNHKYLVYFAVYQFKSIHVGRD